MSKLVGQTAPPAECSPESVDLWRVVFTLKRSHGASYGAEQTRDVILIQWHSTEGVSGWGECPTFSKSGYVTETTDQAWSELSTNLIPAVLATTGPSTAAVSALRDAHLDCVLRSKGISLVDHLGGRRRPLQRTVVIASPTHNGDATAINEIVRRAREAVSSRAEIVKLKIGPGADIDVLEALADSIGADRLAADANGAYESCSQLAEVDRIGMRYLEQPFGAGIDWRELAREASGLETPVALDESIRTLDDVERAAASGAGRIVSIKPARVGGVESAAELIGRAHELGLGAFVGGMVELAVGRAASLAVASIPMLTHPTDLGPSSTYFDRDVSSGLDLDTAGRITAPLGPGLGIEPDMNVITRHAVDQLTIRST